MSSANLTKRIVIPPTPAPTGNNIVSGLSSLSDIVYYNGNIYVSNYGGNKIGRYSLATQTYTSAFVNTSTNPYGIDVSNGNIYVACNSGVIQIFSVYTGSAYGNVTVPSNTSGLTIMGNFIYTSNNGTNTINIYGLTPSVSLVSSITTVTSYNKYLSSYNGNLYVCAPFESGNVGRYTLATNGLSVTASNASFITGLSQPVKTTFLNNILYIGQNTGNIAKYSLTGTVYDKNYFSTSFAAPTTWVQGVTTDGGNIYAGIGDRYITKFNVVEPIARGITFTGVYGLAVDKNSNIYTHQTYGTDVIYKWIKSTSSIISITTGKTMTGLAISNSGNIYLQSSVDGNGIYVIQNGISYTNNATVTPTQISSTVASYKAGQGICVDNNDNIYYVSNEGTKPIYKLTPDGVRTQVYSNSGLSSICRPRFDIYQNLWFINYNTNIWKINNANLVLNNTSGTQMYSPGSTSAGIIFPLAISQNNNLYFAGSGNAIYKIALNTGTQTQYSNPNIPAIANITDLYFDASNVLYIASYNTNQIVIISEIGL